MKEIFQYKSIIQSIPSIRTDLETLAQNWSIPSPELRQITLIVEELFSNIIRFAYEDDREHIIEITLSRNGNLITLQIIDDGLAFNPLEYNHARLADPASSDDGGMGLSLIRVFSDSIEYHREEPKNCLVIKKTIRIQPENKET